MSTRWVGFGLLLVAVTFAWWLSRGETDPTDPWEEMVAAEEAIVELGPALARMSASVENLQFPDAQARRLFADPVAIVDIAGPRNGEELAAGAVRSSLPALSGPPLTVARQALDLWRGLLGNASLFEYAAFRVVRGHLEAGDARRLWTELAFEGLARSKGRSSWIRGRQEVTWEATGDARDGGDSRWRVVAWHSRGLETLTVKRPLFTEVLREVTGTEDAARARRSVHEEFVLDLLLRRRGGDAGAALQLPPHPMFQIPSFDHHPGVSVCDVDGDGFDDLYVMARWGANLLFRNRGDGTFEEIGASLGLDITDHTSCALFADLDNDGDTDAFLGRTLAPSLYLVNEGGRFVDRSEELVGGPLPAFVSSVSAVDHDGDGLLDLYCSTYAASVTNDKPTASWAGLLAPEDARELVRLRASAKHHAILNRFGPPNVLLKNLGGGRLVPVTDGPLGQFKNTYQASWADYDNDGDMDVYIANDFAPNHLLQNDGAGVFSDVTNATGTSDLGFGMGASWGDFDHDGRLDLYVSNMYSKAGRRITEKLAGLDPRFAGMARGNTLFRNAEGAFERASGLEPPSLLVEAAGWSWGGQFVDLDNDADLDLFALSGYYTAPAAVGRPIDI